MFKLAAVTHDGVRRHTPQTYASLSSTICWRGPRRPGANNLRFLTLCCVSIELVHTKQVLSVAPDEDTAADLSNSSGLAALPNQGRTVLSNGEQRRPSKSHCIPIVNPAVPEEIAVSMRVPGVKVATYLNSSAGVVRAGSEEADKVVSLTEASASEIAVCARVDLPNGKVRRRGWLLLWDECNWNTLVRLESSAAFGDGELTTMQVLPSKRYLSGEERMLEAKLITCNGHKTIVASSLLQSRRGFVGRASHEVRNCHIYRSLLAVLPIVHVSNVLYFRT